MLIPNLIFKNEFSKYEQIITRQFKNTKHMHKGDILLQPGDERKNCFYVLSGMFSYTIRHEHGGIKTCSMRGEGTIFPLYYSFPNTAVEGSLEVAALSDSQIIIIPKVELKQLMIDIPEISIAMCDTYAKYTTLLTSEISNILFDTSFARICNYLFTQALISNDEIKLTHEEIGNIAGVTRATVTRTLNSLKQKSIISMKRGGISVISLEKLYPYCSYIITSNNQNILR